MYDDILGPVEKEEKSKSTLKKRPRKKTKLRANIKPDPQKTKDANVDSETCEECGHHIEDCECETGLFDFDDEDQWDAGGEIEPSEDIGCLDTCATGKECQGCNLDCMFAFV